MRLVYLPEARLEVLEAVTYYHSCQEGLAADFYRQLQKAEREIIQWPELWKQVGGRYRRRNLDRFPYAIIYHPLPDDVLEVVAVIHQMRKPGYWEERNSA